MKVPSNISRPSVIFSIAIMCAAVFVVAAHDAQAAIPSQQAARGGSQDAQEQPEVDSALRRGVLAAPPGTNVVLNTFNNEPTIAVDPNNPLHIAAATYLGIRVSTDGGLTFQPGVYVAAPAGFATDRGGDSSIGYDSQGRLFWTFLVKNASVGGFDVFVAQCNPSTGAILAGYPVNVSASAGVTNDNFTHSHDKDWLAVDSSATSPFRDRLYVVWTDFASTGIVILTSFSADQGASWSAARTLSDGAEGFVWPSQNTVAPNGDVYAAYHSQTGYLYPNPDGTSGKIFVLRSTDGGATYPQKNLAYGAGAADTTFNVQSGPRLIPGTQFWLQGSVQPRILADPLTAGRIYVVANDQPNGADFADVFIVTSTDNGGTWSEPARVDSGPAGSIQVMPSAAIDPVTGNIVVTYYDNRIGNTNAGGHFLLDVFATMSGNGGTTFTPDFQINTAAFDPDLNAPCRFGPVGCGDVDTVRTLRIGEYNGVAIGRGVASQVWTGNNGSGFQDTVFDQFAALCGAAPATGCRKPTKAGAAVFQLKANAKPSKQSLSWNWGKGEATALADFGDPVNGSTAYQLCVYDSTSTLVMSELVTAAGTCGKKPCWTTSKTGFKYTNKSPAPGGVQQILLTQGASGKAKIKVTGKGTKLGFPTLPLKQDSAVVVQLKNSAGTCWDASYSAPATKSDATQFKDKSD